MALLVRPWLSAGVCKLVWNSGWAPAGQQQAELTVTVVGGRGPLEAEAGPRLQATQNWNKSDRPSSPALCSMQDQPEAPLTSA